MRTYYFEAEKILWEKLCQNLEYDYTMVARARVHAENEAQALELATKKLVERYKDTGIRLGEVRLARHYDTCVDWSYGYGDERSTGDTKSIPDLVGSAKIR